MSSQENMKAITLWQPWATLVEIGAKRIETRSWSTKYRGPLAIHAAKKRPNTLSLTGMETFMEAVKELFMETRYMRGQLPFGYVLATCQLVDCLKVVGLTRVDGVPVEGQLENGMTVSGNELLFGDYAPGRYAWILEDVKPLPALIPAKGRQQLWNWRMTA